MSFIIYLNSHNYGKIQMNKSRKTLKSAQVQPHNIEVLHTAHLTIVLVGLSSVKYSLIADILAVSANATLPEITFSSVL